MRKASSMKRQTVSVSEANSHLACRKKHDYRYGQRLVPIEERKPLTLGKAVHVGLEIWYLTFDRVRAIESMREFLDQSEHGEELFDLALGMLVGYFDHWQGRDDFGVLYVEMPFRASLISPSGRASRIFDLVGRVDMVVRKPDGSLWLVEHKTLGRKDPRCFEKLDTDYQVRAYAWGVSRFLGEQVRGVIYNVLRAKVPTEPEILKNGKLSRRANIDTTLEIFEAALARTGSDPTDYADILDRLRDEGNTFFMREEREFSPEELHRWALDFYYITRDMRRSDAPYRNPTACSMYGGCEYRELCAGLLPADEIPTRYRRLPTRHPELSDVDLASLKPARRRRRNDPIDHGFIESLMAGKQTGGDL